MEVVAFSARGFMTPPGHVELNGGELVEVLRGPNDNRKSALLQGVRLMRYLASRGWPPLGGAFPGLSITTRQFNSDGRAPLEVAAEILTAPQDQEGSTQSGLNLDRLLVRFRVRWDHLTHPAGWSVLQFQTADGRDFATEDATAVMHDIRAAVGMLERAMDALLGNVRSPRPDAWVDGEEPMLNEAERVALDLLAGVRFQSIDPATDEHLYRKRHPLLANKIPQTVDSLVLKGCIERIALPRGECLDITPTGLLACTRGGEAAGLAMGIAGMVQRRSEMEGEAFWCYAPDEARPFNFGAKTEDFHPFAATVIEVMRLTTPGSTTMWYVYEMRSLMEVNDLRGLRLRAEDIRRKEAAEAAARAAAEAEAAAKFESDISASARTGGTAVAAGRDAINVVFNLLDGSLVERAVSRAKDILGRNKRRR